MAKALMAKQRDRAYRQAGGGRDVMIWFSGSEGRWRANPDHAAIAIRRLKACGYAVTNVQTFPVSSPQRDRWVQIIEFSVELPEASPEQRARTVAKIRAGMARARAEGRRLGRPRIGEERVEKIRSLLAQGVSLRAIAATVDVGLGTVARIKRDTRDNSQRPSCD